MAPPQRFDAARFRPDGGIPATGALLIVVLSFATAIGVGMLVSFIHQWFYLVFLFPLGMGLLVGFVGALAVSFGKVRSAFFAGLVGFFAGVVVIGTVHFGDYLRFQREVQQQFPGAPGVSFPKYIDEAAKEGVSIGRPGRAGDRGINLGYYGSYIYWIAEILLAAGLCLVIMKGSTHEPFCTSCHAWKHAVPLAERELDTARTTEALDSGDMQRLRDLDHARGNLLTFTMYRCEGCTEGTVEIKVQQTTENAKGQKSVAEVGTWSYPAESQSAWLQVFDISEVKPI